MTVALHDPEPDGINGWVLAEAPGPYGTTAATLHFIGKLSDYPQGRTIQVEFE